MALRKRSDSICSSVNLSRASTAVTEDEASVLMVPPVATASPTASEAVTQELDFNSTPAILVKDDTNDHELDSESTFSMNLASRNSSHSSLSAARQSPRSTKPPTPTRILKHQKEPTNISKLALAHLMCVNPKDNHTSNKYKDETEAGVREASDNDCIITAVQDLPGNNAVDEESSKNDFRSPSPKACLRTSLPSYRKLCHGAGIPAKDQPPMDYQQTNLRHQEAQDASERSTMSTVASRALLNTEGIVAGYMSAIQPNSGPDAPLQSVEVQSQAGRDHIQHIRRQRANVFADIVKRSVMMTLSNKVRVSIADEIRVRFTNLLSDQEKDPKFSRSILRTRARRYWIEMHEAFGSTRKSHDQRGPHEIHLIGEIFSERDQIIALYFWAQYQEQVRYSEISFELLLPLGALLDWILQMCAYL